MSNFSSNKTKINDWYHSLSTLEKKSIEQGLQDLDYGNIVSHKDVMTSVKNKIAALKL